MPDEPVATAGVYVLIAACIGFAGAYITREHVGQRVANTLFGIVILIGVGGVLLILIPGRQPQSDRPQVAAKTTVTAATSQSGLAARTSTASVMKATPTPTRLTMAPPTRSLPFGAALPSATVFHTPQPPRTPKPPVLTALPAPYQGVWKGMIVELDTTDANEFYRIEITLSGGEIGDIAGSVGYPSLQCGGDLILRKVTDVEVNLIEDITYGEDKCIDGGRIAIKLVGDRTLQFQWRDEQGQLIAKSTLRRSQ